MDSHAKQLHLILQQMLQDLDELCRNNDLPYQLAAGSLLGAVREGHIIAWDKDADICLLRDDFDRFMALAESQLSSDYFLQHHGSEPVMFSLVTKLRKRGTRRVYPSKNIQSHMHEGIAVDVFPFDAVQPNSWHGRLHMWLCANVKPILLIRTVGDDERIWNINRGLITKSLVWLAYQTVRFIPKPRLMAAYYWLVTYYSRKPNPTGYVACLVSMPRAAQKRLPRIRPLHSFEQTCTVTLGGYAFPAPHNYHEVLTNLYGDYLQPPPAEERELGMQVELTAHD